MKIYIFCTTCERASYLEVIDNNDINLNNFKTVKEVIEELVKKIVSKIPKWVPGRTAYFGRINIYNGRAYFFDSNNKGGSASF